MNKTSEKLPERPIQEYLIVSALYAREYDALVAVGQCWSERLYSLGEQRKTLCTLAAACVLGRTVRVG